MIRIRSFIFCIVFILIPFFSFSEEAVDKKTGFKPFTEVIRETGEQVKQKISGIERIELYVEYIYLDNKKTCFAKIRMVCYIDSEEMKSLSKAKIDKAIEESFKTAVDNKRCWAMFLCEVVDAQVDYEFILISKDKSKNKNVA